MATHADKAEGVHLEYSNTPAIDDNHTLQKVDTADTVHNDEAVTVLAHYDGDQEWTKDEEKRLVRKIDRRLLVILTLSFGIQFYDKYMLSHAVGKADSFNMKICLTFLGHLWTHYGPRPRGKSVFNGIVYFLPGLYRRSLSGFLTRSATQHSPRYFYPYFYMGTLRHGNRPLHHLPWLIRSTILPWLPRIWRVSYVDGRCRLLVYQRRADASSGVRTSPQMLKLILTHCV